MIEQEKIERVWFIGIGGIGMSAIARYFHMKGILVAGYDRTPSVVTEALEQEGVSVVFNDACELIDEVFHDASTTLVVYTPAVEHSQKQLVWFRENGFSVMKRAEVLGLITRESKAICIAGTHGKTTISTMTTHLFRQSRQGCTAFLGGISKNYATNFLWDGNSPFTVLEADEFDRSFLRLNPASALVSAVDPDHLDIYGDRESFRQAFIDFGRKICENGCLVVNAALTVDWQLAEGVKVYTYSAAQKADFYATDIRMEDGYYVFTLVTPEAKIENLKMGVPGLLNVENAVGAAALALINGVLPGEIQEALPLFSGIARRFETHINTGDLIYIDDYAHHPEEIRATVNSVRAMYPNHRITGIFQPHLYSRTKDFAKEFAVALELLDELFLLDIYPARELPVAGVDSALIGSDVRRIPVHLCSKELLPEMLSLQLPQVFLSMGAGDIDREVAAIKKRLMSLINKM